MIASLSFSLSHGRPVTKAGSLSLALLLSYTGCASHEENPTVAQVGDRAITAPDVRDFIDKLPEHAKGEEAGKEQLRDHLQTMIDMELLLMEARSQGREKSPAFLTRMRRIRKTKLVSEYERRTIDATVEDSELQEYIDQEGLARAIRLADIMVPDLQTAATAVREIEGGASFADVARKLSMNEETAARGGDIGRFTTRDEIIPVLAQKLFGLALGSVSDPVRIGDRYVVFKILDETTAQLNPGQRMKIAEKLERKKHGIAKAELVAQLRDEYRLEPVRDGIAAAVEALRTGAAHVGHDPSAIVLYQYDGGEITAADLIGAAKSRKGKVLETLRDAEQVVSFAEQYIVPDMMIQEAAVRQGIDREEEVVQWLEEQGKQVLVRSLRANVLTERVTITEDDLRQYYEANAERFLHPEQTEVQEILVRTEIEALRLKGMIEDGAAFGDLARDIRFDRSRCVMTRVDSTCTVTNRPSSAVSWKLRLRPKSASSRDRSRCMRATPSSRCSPGSASARPSTKLSSGSNLSSDARDAGTRSTSTWRNCAVATSQRCQSTRTGSKPRLPCSRGNDSASLANHQDLVGGQIFKALDQTARPEYFQPVYSSALAQAEVDP